MTDLTPASADLLSKLLDEGARNGFYESTHGCFMMDGDLTPAERGNLTDLKVRGLIETSPDDRGYWVLFSTQALSLTAEGRRHMEWWGEDNDTPIWDGT